ncbi:MAG: hypothetical protein J3K34DRAFT_455925 [Monoraphidium minutum]|nr:MAG: hypothetical protein J3K34DRAFT_455925 [Monoraphidium minutum]
MAPFGVFGPPCPASATAAAAGGGARGGGARGGGALGGGEQQHGLGLVGRHINVEAAKLAGLVGAQLLLHFASLQRGGEELHGRMPWRHLRLPWQRPPGGGPPGGPSGAAAGRGAFQPGEAARRWVAKGVEAERALDLREALSCYQSAVALEPGNLEYVCRLAKQWSDLTYEPGASSAQIAEANTKGMEYAERAIALAPKAAGGFMASCVSKGRLALFSDNKTKVRLAKEAREAAAMALALEPQNDLAHHLMGRWHFEMAQINFVVRQLIKLVYGASLAPGTFEDALSAFSSAASLNPSKLIHRVELGRTLLRLGRRQEALDALEGSVHLEVEDVNARLQLDDAQLLLARLRREFGRASGPLSLAWGGAPLGGGGGGGGGAQEGRGGGGGAAAA